MLVLFLAAQLMILKSNSRIPGVSLWALGNVVLGIGCLFFVLFFGGILDLPLVAVLCGNGLVVVGFYLVYLGVCALVMRSPARHGLFSALFALYLVASVYVSMEENMTLLRAALTSLFIAFLCGCVVKEIRGKLAEKCLIHWIFAGLICCHGLFNVWRALAILQVVPGDNLAYGGGMARVTFVESFIMLYAVSLVYLLLISQHLQEELKNKARVDHLTGLYNRRAFFDLSERVFERARVSGTTVGLLVLDLDHFKTVNDTYGHLAGDRVLSAFSRSASGVLRPMDLMARTGGEEFVVLIPEADENLALDVAERIRAVTESLVVPDEEWFLGITVSVGVALGWPAEGSDFRSLFLEADMALYRAKALGRNRVQFAGGTPLSDEGEPVAVRQA